MTSHDVVDAVRKITGERRVGHAGTLDPFATGILVVGIGRDSTKKLGGISKNSEKEYIAVLELGKTTNTLDPESEVISVNPRKSALISVEDIEHVLDRFRGKITQIPPKHSAVKIGGERAYKKARRGEKIDMPKREVEIYKLELIEWATPRLKLKVVCSSGTYIRALARDIGEILGVGAYLTELTRTRVGDYHIKDSITLENLPRLLA